MTAAEYLVEAERHAASAVHGPEAERPVEAQLAQAFANMAVAAALLESAAAAAEETYLRGEAP